MERDALQHLAWGDFSLKRAVVTALVAYGASCLLAFYYVDRLIFQPQPASYGDGAWTIKLTTGDGLKISAVYLANENASYTILYSHGNAEDLGDVLPFLAELKATGFAVFAYDYHGYGTSQGRASEQNAYRDIDAAYDYLTRRLGVPPQRIIAHGYSVGSGPATDLATRRPLGGLILESPFLTALRVVTPVSPFPFDRFRNIDKIGNVGCPVLVIHGTKDRVIPFSHGERLFREAHGPKRFLPVAGADHFNLRQVAGNRYGEALHDFARLITTVGEGGGEPGESGR